MNNQPEDFRSVNNPYGQGSPNPQPHAYPGQPTQQFGQAQPAGQQPYTQPQPEAQYAQQNPQPQPEGHYAQQAQPSAFGSSTPEPTRQYEQFEPQMGGASGNVAPGGNGGDNSMPQGAAVAAAPEPKKRHTLGMPAVLSLMLVSAVGAGSAVGLGLSAANQHNDNSHVVNALNEPAVQRTGTTEPGDVEQVAANVLPSVVSIRVSSRNAVEEGSGSIISSDGYVLTNNHVVGSAAQGSDIQVTLNDGSTMDADFVAGDAETDIAVIKIRGANDLPVISLGDSSQVRVGQQVVAIGSPLGLSATVTTGIVSALNRPVRASGGDGGESSLIDAIQTDAAINPGNSGGPLVDMNGNLIGMNSVIASMSNGEGQAGSIGLGFAIPVNQARRLAQQLIDNGRVSQPKIGVSLNPNDRYRGALIADVAKGSPADEAGLRPGELVVGVNDRVIDSNDALIAAIRGFEFGDTITLKVRTSDDQQPREVQVTLPAE